MTLSEIKTEDGVALDTVSEVHSVATAYPETMEIRRSWPTNIYAKHIQMQYCDGCGYWNATIYRGRLLGVFADRTELESGLGRGATT